MIDDPLFDPIFAYLTREERPLLLHIGEPLACWQPLDEDNPHYQPFSTLSDAERQDALASADERYGQHFAYFESDQIVTVRGREVQGVGAFGGDSGAVLPAQRTTLVSGHIDE